VPKPTPLAVRLAARTVQTAGGCWVYEDGHASRSGHKQIWDNDRRKMVLVRRVAYALAHGPIPDGKPDGKLVCHHCDNPPCVNPAHLYLGIVADNNRDRDERGRHRPLRGAENGNAKLTENQVLEILRRAGRGEPQHLIAAAFGVTQGNVSYIYIVRGKTRRALTGAGVGP
jgi:hypothetical protein